jgi:hypothetical protein
MTPKTSLCAREEAVAYQREWATSQRLPFSNGYLTEVGHNLRSPLSKGARSAFARGSGSELMSRGPKPPKMCALHSSSALAVNVFDFWTERPNSVLAQRLGMKRQEVTVSFEKQFPTGLRGVPPNLDIVIRGKEDPFVAIESKFTEWMTPKRKRPVFKGKYFPHGKRWWAEKGLVECQLIAERIQTNDVVYRFLDVAQLLKHMLGLAAAGGPWRLLYLFFDCSGPIAEQHHAEIKEFTVALGPRTPFESMTYQHLVGSFQDATDVDVIEFQRWLSNRYFRPST